MRLNRYLARAGVASRRAADDLIKAGRVTVNGRRGELNTFVAGRDVVEVDGERVGKQELAHVLLHKPLGVVTTAHDPEGRPTVVDLVGHESRVVPVGRLDIDTSGVILLTNDGDLAHRLAHPRYGVEKTYVADVEGDHRACPRPAARALTGRDRPPRGPQPAGTPYVRGDRPSGRAAATHRLRRARREGRRGGRLPRSDP
jgi:16S rRNA U516 pseudouridylate synthase RsuA-like enzyme